MTETTWSRIWWGGFIAFFCATFLFKPITDPDFFWHLKHGQWLWEHGALPTADPFALVPQPADPRQQLILTMYWLSQLGYFALYRAFDWWGFFLLKGALFVGLLLALQARRHTRPLVHAGLSSLLLLTIFHRFPTERPQFLSFCAFALLLALSERLLDNPSGKINRAVAAGLPLLLLVWCNLHPLVLIGQIFCVFAPFNYWWQYREGRLQKDLLKKCLLVFALALGCSFLSPNGLRWFSALSQLGSEDYTIYFKDIPEYASIFNAVFARGVYIYLVFIVLSALAVFDLLANGFRRNVPALLLLLAFAVVAFGSVRYLPFLGILAIASAGNALARFGKVWTGVILLLLLGGGLFLTKNNLGNYNALRESGPIADFFPKQAVAVLKETGVNGYGLNYFAWGGYVLFMLGEGNEMFVDGRTLYPERYRDYVTLGSLGQGRGDLATLKHLFDKYRFDYTILPKVHKGRTVWLNGALLRLGGWRAIHDQDNVVVLVRAGR